MIWCVLQLMNVFAQIHVRNPVRDLRSPSFLPSFRWFLFGVVFFSWYERVRATSVETTWNAFFSVPTHGLTPNGMAETSNGLLSWSGYEYISGSLNNGIIVTQKADTGDFVESFQVGFNGYSQFYTHTSIGNTSFAGGYTNPQGGAWLVELNSTASIRSWSLQNLGGSSSSSAIYAMTSNGTWPLNVMGWSETTAVALDVNTEKHQVTGKSFSSSLGNLIGTVRTTDGHAQYYGGQVIENAMYSKIWLTREGVWSRSLQDPAGGAMWINTMLVSNDIVYLGGSVNDVAFLGTLNATTGKTITLRKLLYSKIFRKLVLTPSGEVIAVGSDQTSNNALILQVSHNITTTKKSILLTTYQQGNGFTDILVDSQTGNLRLSGFITTSSASYSAIIHFDEELNLAFHALPSYIVESTSEGLLSNYQSFNLTNRPLSLTITPLSPTLVENTQQLTVNRNILTQSWPPEPTSQPTSQPSLQPTASLPNSLRDGLVAYYPFDGNANDNSGNNHDGVAHSTTFVADKFGHALKACQFDGRSSYVSINNGAFNFTNSFSASLWVKPGIQVASDAVLIDYHTGNVGWSIKQYSGVQNTYSLLYRQALTNEWAFSANTLLPLNEWSHLTIVKNNTALTTYLNGEKISTTYGASARIKLDNTLVPVIGASSALYGYFFFNGSISQVFIHDRPLWATEVKSLYDLDVPTSQPSSQPTSQPTFQPTVSLPSSLRDGLVAYYPFDGDANDNSGNGNNGVVRSATLTMDRFGFANRAYAFDGSNAYIEIVDGSSFNFVNDFSIAFWANPVAVSTDSIPHIFTNGAVVYFEIHRDDNNNFYTGYYDKSSTFQSAGISRLTSNAWNHFVFTKKGKVLKYYLNNFLGGVNNATTSLVASGENKPFLIGAYNGGQTQPASQVNGYFQGYLDDIYIYNRTLSSAEVFQLYNFDVPTSQPSRQPTTQPSMQPSHQPSSRPSRKPSGQPSRQPSSRPSRFPTVRPSGYPSSFPTSQPTNRPSLQPTNRPSRQPTTQPSMQPSGQPSSRPSRKPSGQPSRQPSSRPSRFPTVRPSGYPSRFPSSVPSRQPSGKPTSQPSRQPTSRPSVQPSRQPTSEPSAQPSNQPSMQPSKQPSAQPTRQPSQQPSAQPSRKPSGQPSSKPSIRPSRQPSSRPSRFPSSMPTRQPSQQPTRKPTRQPTNQPTAQPSRKPTGQPSSKPSIRPSRQPSSRPSRFPSSMPTRQPTRQPSQQPTRKPTRQPSQQPTNQPTAQPSMEPSGQPSRWPTRRPTQQPSAQPSRQPTSQPSSRPSKQPSAQPSRRPSRQPTSRPSVQPSWQPTSKPSAQPSHQPSAQPSSKPSARPPSHRPSMSPTPFDIVGYVDELSRQERQHRLANITAVITELALESALRSNADAEFAAALSTETQQRLFNFTFAMTQLLLESQFRSGNDTYLFQYFSHQLNSTRIEFKQNIASRMAESLKNSDTTASVLNSLGNTLQLQIDTEIRDRTTQDNHLLQFITNTSLLAAHLSSKLVGINGNVSLLHLWMTNQSEFASENFEAIRQELNSTRTDFNKNIATRMAESLQNADTTATVLESLGNTLQEQISQVKDRNQVLANQLNGLGNMTALFIAELNTSITQSVNHTDVLFRQISLLMNAFSSQTTQRFMELSSGLENSSRTLERLVAETNSSLHAYCQVGLQDQADTFQKSLQNQSDILNQKVDEQGNSLRQTISALGLSDGTDYQIPSKEVTDVVTQKAAAIDALDDPMLQQLRRYFDLALSIKEIILICAFVFNAVMLINGMSVMESLQYVFALPIRRELDKLRQGKTGPTGPNFEKFVACLEKIIIERDFSTDERLERLAKLSQIQRFKVDSIRLFSSNKGPKQIQEDLKRLQESCLVGLLRRPNDSFHAVIANNLYSDYSQWRRINLIRTLIYSILRSYAGATVAEENKTLGRRETWQFRTRLRGSIAANWKLFYTRLQSSTTMPLPKSADPVSLALKMHIEIDQQGPANFSRYIHKMHVKLCLLYYIPFMMQDLYCLKADGSRRVTVDRTIKIITDAYPEITQDGLSTIFIKHNKIIREFNAIMDGVVQLYTIKSWIYDQIGIPRSLASLSKSEKELRARLAQKLCDNFNAILEFITTAIPLFSAWMSEYNSIAEHCDAPLSGQIKRVENRIAEITDNAEEFERKYREIIHKLSTEFGMPGLVDLIDLSANLNRQSDHSDLLVGRKASVGRKARAIHPDSHQQIKAHSDIRSPGSPFPIIDSDDDSYRDFYEEFPFSDDDDDVEAIRPAKYHSKIRVAEQASSVLTKKNVSNNDDSRDDVSYDSSGNFIFSESGSYCDSLRHYTLSDNSELDVAQQSRYCSEIRTAKKPLRELLKVNSRDNFFQECRLEQGKSSRNSSFDQNDHFDSSDSDDGASALNASIFR